MYVVSRLNVNNEVMLGYNSFLHLCSHCSVTFKRDLLRQDHVTLHLTFLISGSSEAGTKIFSFLSLICFDKVKKNKDWLFIIIIIIIHSWCICQ